LTTDNEKKRVTYFREKSIDHRMAGGISKSKYEGTKRGTAVLRSGQ